MKSIIILFLILVLVSCNTKKKDETTTAADPTPNPAPSGFVYTEQNVLLNKDKILVSLNPSYFGSPTSFIVSPALPAGLTINSSTGVISGTPLVEMEKTTYIVTASNNFGSDTASFDLTVLHALPKLVKNNLKVGGGSLNGSPIGQYESNLLFGNNINGGQLWISNGTESGTSLITQFDGASGFSPQSFIKFGLFTYFLADSISNGIELYKTDGTSAGTTLVKNLTAGSASSTIRNFVVSGNYLYFIANIGAGEQLFRTDGTAVGTIQLSNFDVAPVELTAHNNLLYFAADDNLNGDELWASDGNSISLIANIDNEITSSSPRKLTSVGQFLYFKADSSNGSGSELYRLNNLTNTVSMVFDVVPGATGSSIDFIFNFQGAALFSAYSAVTGRELYISSDFSTNIISDLETGSSNSTPSGLVEYNDEVYFYAYKQSSGFELYKTDGVDISLVKDFNTGSINSTVGNFININNFLYLTSSNFSNKEIHRVDNEGSINLIQNYVTPSNSHELIYFSNINNQKLMFFKRDIANDSFELHSVSP